MSTGRILHIQRLSTEDGPGIRTTVFFKGCPLSCKWCHNPESISRQMQTQWFADRCLGCGTCVDTCPNGCLTLAEDGHQHKDHAKCELCGMCARACPSGAIEFLGKDVAVEALIHELLKDRAYFEKSAGGVTLSGGEPTFQPEFAEGLLRSLKAHGVSTALDTCGLTSKKVLERLLPYVDLLLFDLKIIENSRHLMFTGQSNTRILENLLYINDWFQSHNSETEIWIRTPLIPGATDDEENLQTIGKFLSHNLGESISRWELCAFNNLCRDQYTRLDLEWDFAGTPLMTPEALSHCERVARSSFSRPQIVLATGATRLPEVV